MKKQYAVFGLGNFGTSVALTLQNLGCEVVAVDSSMEKVQQIADSVSYAMRAEINDPSLVRSLGARNLDGIIVAISENMEASIMATLLAKEVGVPYVLAKAQNDLHATILKKIGADAIVYPEREMGERIAKNLVSTDFADWISLSPDYSMMEVEIPEKWVGKTLRELDVRQLHGVNVVGYMEGDKVEINPDPSEALRGEMIMILIGTNQALQTFKKG